MKKKLAILMAAAVFTLTAFTGCGSSNSSASSGNDGIKILLIINVMDNFRQTLVDGASAAASEQGVQLDVKDAEESIENQYAFIKSAEADGYDVIICSPVSIDTTVALKASAGDLPIVFINSCPNEKYLEAGQYIYVGSDEKVAGQYQAEYVLDELADKSELNVAILKGPKGHSATTGRTKGAKETLEASGKTINYVFDDFANWSQDTAAELFSVSLTTGTTPDCVICNNDDMALGIIDACKEENIDLDKLPVLGVDATANGCEAIEDGDMAFTVYQSGKGQGTAAVEAAAHLAKGESIASMDGVTDDEKYVWVPFEKVDASNVSDYK